MPRRLSQLSVLQTATIVGISETDPLVRGRLADLGFSIGAAVRVIARAGLGGPIAVKTPGGVFALRQVEADYIHVM